VARELLNGEVPLGETQTIPAADDGDDHGEAQSHVGLVETAHILRRGQAGQSDGRRVRARVATGLAILPSVQADDLTNCASSADVKTPNGRDQMSFRANVLPCQWPPGLEFYEKHVWSTYVWRPVFFRQILR
jgi:hypothetical protein